jgi:hypothetical protein
MENTMKRSLGLGVMLAIAPLALASCGSKGAAVGALTTPSGESEGTVTLVWKSDALAPERGEISGTLPDGTPYKGRYFEVTETAEPDLYAPAWEGWQPYWSEWPMDGEVDNMDWSQFARTYNGTVIANLVATDGKSRIRCRFIIDTPATGLAGGSNGQCQTSGGESISDVGLARQ